MKKAILLSLAVVIVVTVAFASSRFFESISISNNTTFKPQTLASSAGTLTLPAGTHFSLTGTEAITALSASNTSGRIIYITTTGTASLADGNNLLLAGNFSGTANDVLVLLAVGANWVEVSRSAN